MVTRLFLTACAFGAVVSAVLLAPVPKADPVRGPFLATAAGARWTYRVRVAGEDLTVVFATRKVAAGGDGATTVTLDGVEGPNGYAGGRFVVTEDGLDEAAGFPFGSINRPPVRALRLPFRDGDQWEATTTSWDLKRVGSYAAYGPERVEVPAGRYAAVRVEAAWVTEDGRADPPWKITKWYAANVGIVKLVTPRETFELTAFAPGKP